MGQYYKFVNKTRQEESQISLPFNFGLSYAKSLEHYDRDEVEAMFRYVITHNDEWGEEDDVVAIGDYGSTMSYKEFKNPDKGHSWEKYVPEKVPPRKIDDPDKVWER